MGGDVLGLNCYMIPMLITQKNTYVAAFYHETGVIDDSCWCASIHRYRIFEKWNPRQYFFFFQWISLGMESWHDNMTIFEQYHFGGNHKKSHISETWGKSITCFLQPQKNFIVFGFPVTCVIFLLIVVFLLQNQNNTELFPLLFCNGRSWRSYGKDVALRVLYPIG